MAVRRWLAASAIAASIIALTGCMGAGGPQRPDVPHDAASGGQTLSEMKDQLKSVEGIVVSDISGGGRPNIKGNTGYSVMLEVDSGYTIVDGAALVDFVITSVWSVREGYMPNATIDIRVRMPDGRTFDVAAAAADGGWAPASATTAREFSSVSVSVSESKEQGLSNRERLGQWPGAVPAVPANVTAPE